jgi:shikimate kinase
MSILLLGYRGSGKTTIGRLLADRLWQTFIDTDEMIVRKAGRSIASIFADYGEVAFRDLEADILREVLLLEDHVISLGGGAVLREENRRLLIASTHKRIYLRCDPEVLVQRIHADPGTAANRPALTHIGGGIEEVRQVLAQREPVYRQVMTAELDVTHLSPQEACSYIVRLL